MSERENIIENEGYGSVDAFLRSIAKEKLYPIDEPEPSSDTYGDYEDRGELAVGEMEVDIQDLHFENTEEIENRIEIALRNGDNILFVGPPGTGKTKLAKQVCESIVGDDYEIVTANADWSTFDTIGGYRPEEDDLVFYPGVFLDRFQDKNGNPTNEWLVIDEMNRADIDKAFGSLFTALTGENITLPFTDEDGNSIELLGDDSARYLSVRPHRHYIPEDWRMIATMNTLDKTSLYEMSYAFMRRWSFVPIGVPDRANIDGELVGSYVRLWNEVTIDEDRCENVADIWRIANSYREIGPAIVEDIYSYVETSDDDDYTSPIIMRVLPQFEGIREGQIVEFVERLGTETEVNREKVASFSADYFQIPRKKFED